MTGTILVNETFGPTIQGEGRYAGQLAYFIRLAGCNQHCWWCDTPYTWAYNERLALQHKDGKRYNLQDERFQMDVETVMANLPNTDHLIVISGGEPMLQASVLHGLCERLLACGYRVGIETAGTISPMHWGNVAYHVGWTVSPKLENSGNELQKRCKPEVLRLFRECNADFKFVVCDEQDLAEIEWIQKEVDIPNTQMWLMAEGTSSDRREVERTLIPLVLERNWNLSPRKHIELWGDERGR